jgi:hypothetical protein
MPKQPAENPLLSKKIPAPPPVVAREAVPAERENGMGAPGYQSEMGKEQQGARGKEQPEQEEERATVELSLYLRPSQDDKLEDLRRAYKRRTGKKISANEVIRRLIERAMLESLLQE